MFLKNGKKEIKKGKDIERKTERKNIDTKTYTQRGMDIKLKRGQKKKRKGKKYTERKQTNKRRKITNKYFYGFSKGLKSVCTEKYGVEKMDVV